MSVTEESNSDVLNAGRGTAAPDTDGNIHLKFSKLIPNTVTIHLQT